VRIVPPFTVLEALRSAARDWEASGRDRAWLNHAGSQLHDAEQIAARIDFAGMLPDKITPRQGAIDMNKKSRAVVERPRPSP